jgi:hypothetical protein
MGTVRWTGVFYDFRNRRTRGKQVDFLESFLSYYEFLQHNIIFLITWILAV